MFKVRKRMTPVRKYRRKLPNNMKVSPKTPKYASSDIQQTYTK
jgi:hypothetical protein